MFDRFDSVNSESAPEEFADVSGIVLAHLLAPLLADLSSVPDGMDGDAALVDASVALARLGSWVAAQQGRVAAEMLRRARAEVAAEASVHRDGRGTASAFSHDFEDERMARSMVSLDLSLALGITGWSADRDMLLGERLAQQPELGRALASGRLDRRRVEIILSETALLTGAADRRAVIRMIVGDGTHAADIAGNRDGLIRELRRPGTSLIQLSPSKVGRAVRRECHRRDAQMAATREAAATQARGLAFGIRSDAQAEMVLTGPACEVSAAYTNVDLAARAARSAGDPRNLDQLRHDVAVGWLTEGAFGTLVERPDQQMAGGQHSRRAVLPRPRQVLTVIALSDRTALGLDEDPATLFGPDGQVPLPAAVGRAIAHDPELSTWLGLYTDPHTGVALDVSSGYRPPPRQRRFVALRDGMRSRLPSSSSTRVELDHVQAYNHDDPSAGGRTTPSGLACAGLREHHLKTDGALTVVGDANGQLRYRTHTGHTYVSWPEIWAEPRAG
ncbi:MAG: hypothetical protein ACJ71T_00280 [Actinomycetales bacterium]